MGSMLPYIAYMDPMGYEPWDLGVPYFQTAIFSPRKNGGFSIKGGLGLLEG